MYKFNSKSKNANEFINDEKILETIFEVENGNYDIQKILNKSKEMKGLEPDEALALLLCKDKNIENEIYEIAKKIKLEIYGRRIVLFAPLYLSNYCINGCVYCPYHSKNKNKARKKLTQEEAERLINMLKNSQIGRAHVWTAVTPENLVCRLLLEKKKKRE